MSNLIFVAVDSSLVKSNDGIWVADLNPLGRGFRVYEQDKAAPEPTSFKCQANHRDKGHVKPFYRRGRW